MPIKHIFTNNMPNNIADKWTFFYTTPPLSPFQVAIVVTNYNRIVINENITLWCGSCLQNQQLFNFAKRITENITLHLKAEFSETDVDIPKMDHFVIPNFVQDGTSKWGLIFHTETNLIYDEQSDSVVRKIEVARLIAHKIAYQWFNNIYNSSSWSYDHFPLHDGLAAYFGEEAIYKNLNYSEIKDFLIVHIQYESLHLDSYFNMNPVEITNSSKFVSLFSFPRYLNVLIVLRMLRIAISDIEFRRAVHMYVHLTFHSTISIDFSSKIRSKSNICYVPSYKFLTWQKYRGYPIVVLRLENYYFGILSQKLSYNLTTDGNWWIFINLKNVIKAPFTLRDDLVCIRPKMSNFIKQDQINWTHNFIVDIEQAGYYRVKYETEGWQTITKYLTSTTGEYNNISAINRAKIVDDAFHLMMEHQLNASIFWNLTQYLSQETNYVAWYPMFKIFEYMSTIFPFSEEEIKFDFKTKFTELLNEPLKTIENNTYRVPNYFIKCLKQEILRWACTLQHQHCVRMAKHTLEEHLENPDKNP
ncbi:Aminopeptidase N [Cyphomyrmex costatus]|uniref:Aminopeptidase N n=1 Tax=Cyphomyrmex costatus TaxID=456900 RepID=A0A195C909_9HYME|nr:Aminopeptidase N [Cyphomyrmex costatus]